MRKHILWLITLSLAFGLLLAESPDIATLKEILNKAKSGDIEAQFQMSGYYAEGIGVEEDVSKPCAGCVKPPRVATPKLNTGWELFIHVTSARPFSGLPKLVKMAIWQRKSIWELTMPAAARTQKRPSSGS